MNIDTAEILLASVTSRALALHPGNMREAERVNDLLGTVLLAGEAQPVINDYVFVLKSATFQPNVTPLRIDCR